MIEWMRAHPWMALLLLGPGTPLAVSMTLSAQAIVWRLMKKP